MKQKTEKNNPGIPWLDTEKWGISLEGKLTSGVITEVQARWCNKFAQVGFLVIEKLISDDKIDRVWKAYEKFYQGNKEKFYTSNFPGDPWPERFLNTHFSVPEVAEILHYPKLLEITKILFDRRTCPFQTITSHKGTEQAAHSDSIHMTTKPPGYLIAAWIACEDVHPDSGPLYYYPKSHRLPYVLSKNVGISNEDFEERQHGIYHERYEPHIQELIFRHSLRRKEFLAKKGDVLLWHANLLHGAEVRRDLTLSRKALVCHYFAEGVDCYHDLSGRKVSFSGEEGVAVPPVSRR